MYWMLLLLIDLLQITAILQLLVKDQPPLNLNSDSKISGSTWGPNVAGKKKSSEEGTVIVRNGELLCGVLDKNQFGASSFGLVHVCVGHSLVDLTRTLNYV